MGHLGRRLKMINKISQTQLNVKSLSLSVSSPWVISSPGGVKHNQEYPVMIFDERSSELEKQSKKLNALYFLPNEWKRNDSVILHFHGGGFCFSKPENHAGYLSILSNKTGIPIICPDYGKAPEDKFPGGLQDSLDTYFMLKNLKEMKQLLGFSPSKIIVSGDSAGGNFAVSLCIALNEIRKCDPRMRDCMPASVCLLFPYNDPSLKMSASKALTPILSSLVSPRRLATSFISYAPTGIRYPSLDWYERREEIETWTRLTAPATSEPLINNLAYLEDLVDLRDVSCSIVTGEFDYVLDGNLQMAKYWPGSTIHVLEEGHGWCCFATLETHDQEFNLVADMMTKGIRT